MTGDYKPCLTQLPGGELLLVMFASVDLGKEIREDMILYRSSDGANTSGERTVLPLLGRVFQCASRRHPVHYHSFAQR